MIHRHPPWLPAPLPWIGEMSVSRAAAFQDRVFAYAAGNSICDWTVQSTLNFRVRLQIASICSRTLKYRVARNPQKFHTILARCCNQSLKWRVAAIDHPIFAKPHQHVSDLRMRHLGWRECSGVTNGQNTSKWNTTGLILYLPSINVKQIKSLSFSQMCLECHIECPAARASPNSGRNSIFCLLENLECHLERHIEFPTANSPI